ncbi:winged helix-turn-helix domain-containing protein [Rhodococcus aetherivorans]
MTTSSIENPAGSSVDSPELVLIVQISDTNAGSAGDLAALADALRETALDLLPDARTHTLLSPGPTPLVIDLPARGLVLDNQRVELSHSEFEILAHLVRRPRVVVSRAALRPLGAGYSENDDVDSDRGNRSVDVHVSRIRSKLGRFGNIITTVRGSGYRFDPDPRVHVVEVLDRRTA